MSNLVNDIVKFMKLVEMNKDMAGGEKKARVIDSVKFRNQEADKSLISAIIDNLISIEKGEIKISQVQRKFCKNLQTSSLNCCSCAGVSASDIRRPLG